jgi:hypothetical protein
MPPPAATLDALAAAEEARDALLDRTSAALRDLLEQLRRRLAGQIPADSERLMRQFSELRRLIDGELGHLAVHGARVVNGAQAESVGLAQGLVDAPLLAGGVGVALPELRLPLLELLQEIAADRITGLTTALRDQIVSQIQLTVLGAQDAVTSMDQIFRLLDGSGAGRLDGATRAEAIVRTEVGRTHSQATQRRLEQAMRQVDGLQKEWRHSGLSRNPRSGHVAANGQRVPVSEPFLVAPEVGMAPERVMYPRDPAGSARNTVFCRCVHSPFVSRWLEAAA